MILCGNVFLDELKDTFILCCVLCKKKSRRYNDFTSHVKAKHKELNEKGATPSRQIVKKIKDEDDSDDDEDEGQDESEEQKPEVEVKDEMDVDPHEEFIDDIKYDVQEIEPFIDPILALEEKESADATDVLEALDSDVKDEDYVADELDNDDSDDEDYRDEDNDNAADSETDDNELPISTDKFTPTFYRKKRHVNDFIELYKSQPVLWDINDPLFENPKAQKDAEQAIINGMQKFNIFLKPTGLRSAINQIHKYCVIIKSDLDNGDTKKVTSIAKGYYEKCDFLKDLLAKKAIPEGDKQNNPLTLDKWNETTCKFIDIYAKFPLLYDPDHPLHGKNIEKQKALSEIRSTLLSQHNINFSDEIVTEAIDQLRSWYYSSKRRQHVTNNNDELKKCYSEYLKLCKFLPEKEKRVKFPCSICDKIFYTENHCKYHLSKVHQIGEISFQCTQCGKKLVSNSALQSHTQRVHSGKAYPCEFCGKLFTIRSQLKLHILVHTNEKPHVCELCGKGFRLRNNLGLHVTSMHTKIRAFKCTMCPKDFLKNADLKDHIKTHLNIRDKICDTCGKGFTNCHSLRRHRQIHSEKPLILDKWDDTTCKFIDIYAKFQLLYDGEHPLYGKYEDKQRAITDIRNALLTQHEIDFNEELVSNAIDQLQSWYYLTKRQKHKNKDDAKLAKSCENYLQMCKFLPEKRLKVKIVCSICNKNFYTEHNFKYHLTKVHQVGDFSFQCDLCGKKLISKSALQCHAQRVHSEKKYPCEFCGKLFAIPSELRIHTLVHTAEKPHVCELCGKGFRLRNNLGLHVTRMHTKIRAFKCTMCPKDFLKNCDLKDHIKTHLNIRDKICETCGKGFTNCHSLIRHRQIHSEVKKFACKLCDAKFHQFVGLNGHMKRTHNIVKKDTNN